MARRIKGEFVDVRPHVWMRFQGQRVRFMLDTGFHGDLLITEAQADLLGIKTLGDLSVSWFDGTVAGVEFGDGFIDWFGRARRCRVLIARKGLTLLGMGLIQDARLEVEFAMKHVALIQA